jgi:two-component system response regulator ChvI
MPAPFVVAVNDDQRFLDLVRELLEAEGYRVTTWVDGSTAYPMLKRSQPDAILLDLRLATPDTGLKLLEMLKLDPVTRSIPVIVCSADVRVLDSLDSRVRELRCEVLAKPFDLETLLALLAMVTTGATAPSAA